MARLTAVQSALVQARAGFAPPPRGGTGLRVKNASAYEGGANTRRTYTWRAPTASPNDAVLYNLATLRDRSRNATRNDGYAKGIIDKLVTNIIGTGIKPLSQASVDLKVPHPITKALVPFREALQVLWDLWTDESDADGLLDWYGQQTLSERERLEGGEVFLRLRPRLPVDDLWVPLQVQVIEPELCAHTYNATLASGNRVRAGIEFNGIGKRVAYWFYASVPGDTQDMDTSQLRRLPADSVIHHYDPLRAGQLRGVPHLTQALIKLYELDKYDDATLLRQQLSNLFVAFVKRAAATLGDTGTSHPLTGLPPSETGDGKPFIGLEPGIFQELDPGEEVEFSEPPDPGQGYADFTRQQLYHVAAAAGVPYETLTGDLRGITDRTVRIILHEFRRRLMQIQHQLVAFRVCRPIWNAWIDRVFLSGALPIPVEYLENPEPWRRVKWMPQGWPYLHPVQDVEANKDAIRSGFTTRSAVVSEQGEDAAEIDAEQASDHKRADGLGLKYDSDGRMQPKAKNAVPPAAGDTGG